MTGRSDNLVDLADAVRELTEPRIHSEYLEQVVVETVQRRSGGGTRVKRSKQRRRHVVTLPPLLTSLERAAEPGASEGAQAAGGFESRPAAQLEPLAVLADIITAARYWSEKFGINQPTLAKTLSALVGAQHSDGQLAQIASQADGWVKRARIATGFDPAPFTLDAACVYCGRRNSLVITGDLQTARCQRCGADWDAGTMGLLSTMLAQNRMETLALARCWQTDCTKYGDHTAHGDGRGRTWADTCELSDPDGKLVG